MHGKNCGNFSKCDQIVRIGLPKGNVYGKSKELVTKVIGNEIPEGKLSISYEGYIFYFLKQRDIPVLIDNGILDYGITSDEWIKETRVHVLRLKELDWCDTKIAVIVHKNNTKRLKKCVSEYIEIARKYFGNCEIDIKYVSGSCESLVPTEFDCCVGCVESGTTLRQNDLVVKDIILQSKIVLVGKKDIATDKMEKIYRIL
jgi:ATP phosphoribosyltransferase